jgi:hypothetical protein
MSASSKIKHVLQVYDLRTCGFPLAVFEGGEPFMDIRKGDTMDGRCWPKINGHRDYARIYRVRSVRHTIQANDPGTIMHLKSLFVEAVIR